MMKLSMMKPYSWSPWSVLNLLQRTNAKKRCSKSLIYLICKKLCYLADENIFAFFLTNSFDTALNFTPKLQEMVFKLLFLSKHNVSFFQKTVTLEKLASTLFYLFLCNPESLQKLLGSFFQEIAGKISEGELQVLKIQFGKVLFHGVSVPQPQIPQSTVLERGNISKFVKNVEEMMIVVRPILMRK